MTSLSCSRGWASRPMSRSNLARLFPATDQSQAATGVICICSMVWLIAIEKSEYKHTVTTLYFSNNLTTHMQLKGRHALLVHVRYVCTVVRICLNFVKFNVFTVFTFSSTMKTNICGEHQISDHLDLDLHQ